MKKKDYERLDCPSFGTCPQRAYYVPEGAKVSLSGEWEFRYYPDLRGICEKDPAPIRVPSCWQTEGYDAHMYANARYPFPFDPPHVPENMPCALYTRRFPYTGGNRCYIRFEGVSSFYYLFINGRQVGYSSVSHSGEEYDITDFLHIGENVAEVLNLKWCAGSYLESQDMLRMNGIFREVYLLFRPQNCLWDYFIRPSFGDGEAELHFEFTGADGAEKRVTLSLDGKVAASGQTVGQSLVLRLKDPALWNAERPVLYDVEIAASGEIICQKYALRRVAVENGVFTVNGRAVKLLGVNRHEIDLDFGYVMTEERMRSDLKLIKQGNMNAVRTSHYPDCPRFLELCDEAGVYVVDEADLECHGVLEQNGKSDFDLYDTFADDPRFSAAVADRVQRLVERDKNFGCVVMWSLGNESGWGRCFRSAAREVSKRDPSRVLHYEDINVAPNKRQGEKFEELSIISRMYFNVDWIENVYLAGKDEQVPHIEYDFAQMRRPLFLCEYAHAMGTGPGDLGDYVDCFYRHPEVIGGCVWEFCDHAARGDFGRYKNVPLYGGDFGTAADRLIQETEGNFCMDGLVNERRVPHRGYYEYKNVLRPVRITFENGEFFAENMLFFTRADESFAVLAKIMSGRKVLREVRISLPPLPPRAKKQFALDLSDFSAAEDLYIHFTCYTRGETPFVPADTLAGRDSVQIWSDADKIYRHARSAGTGKVRNDAPASADGRILPADCAEISFSCGGFSCCYDTRGGAILSLRSQGAEFLERPVSFCVTRADMDNDMYNRIFWRGCGLYDAYATGGEIQLTDGGFRQKIALQAMWRKNIAEIWAEYRFFDSGFILRLSAEIGAHIRFLPRFGLLFPLKKSLRHVEWYGNGPCSSYADLCRAAQKGVYRTDARSEYDTHLNPQEYGSRNGTRFLSVSGKEMRLSVYADREISFSALPYAQGELRAKKYAFQLKKSRATELNVDLCMSGAGSGACGEELPPRYRLEQKHMEAEFVFRFENIKGGHSANG